MFKSTAFDLSGKSAIVTGSSRGIGRAIAEELAKAGAKVVVSSRKVEACNAVVAEFASMGLTATSIPCNVSNKAELEQLVRKAREAFGPIDILVCNAAVNPHYGPLAEISDEMYDRIMGSNVRSNLWLSRMVLPDMSARRDVAIIYVSSISGLIGTATIGAYAISKAADLQLARNLACEWGRHNIRVNCIAPGLIKTDFAKPLWENKELLSDTMRKTPLARIGEPAEIGGIAVFLAAPAGRFVTGTCIVADGGITISGAI